MRYREEQVQALSEHLTELAHMTDPGVTVTALRRERGVWDFHVDDEVTGQDRVKPSTTSGYESILMWVRTGC